ncbi:MAG: hypothetical protein ACFFD4_15275 [Candidatus Odinarchaeota archaeon]
MDNSCYSSLQSLTALLANLYPWTRGITGKPVFAVELSRIAVLLSYFRLFWFLSTYLGKNGSQALVPDLKNPKNKCGSYLKRVASCLFQISTILSFKQVLMCHQLPADQVSRA